MNKIKMQEIIQDFTECLEAKITSVEVNGVKREPTLQDQMDFIKACWKETVKRLEELERTAQEVPVQEQSISNNLKANITIKGLNVLEKFSTDSSLGIDTICTDKTSVEVNLFES